eukprot:CAMPEP_0168172252 /NCGR_PEP_ID=MMETSP0139_2-20121125/5140_1 /TAXON_ID=44445 /ORGANISM="Pseudo-nitzschia australis, Strain 10249 10 AB" /LENGTH=384 /DNA_ID=CAMNT_0008089861 /DNA_START=47 /DNA_END=1203 /DNA_ORIENTATION=-
MESEIKKIIKSTKKKKDRKLAKKDMSSTVGSPPKDNGRVRMSRRMTIAPGALAGIALDEIALDDYSNVQTKAEKFAERQEHIRHMKSLYLIVNNKYFINFLSERYFSKMQMFLIFIPIQMLADASGMGDRIEAILLVLNGAPVDGPSDQGTGDALINTLVGAALLILTNLGKALSFERKAEQHKLVAGEMKAVMDQITVHLSTLPTSGFNRAKSTSIRNNVELVFAKSVEMNKQLSPPEQIVMAFDNIDDDITFLKGREKDMLQLLLHKSYGCNVIKINDGFYDVDEETYFNVFRDGYSDLADIISARIAHCIRFAFLPSSKDARIETIAGIVETLDRMGGCAPEEKGLCARLFRTPVRQSEEKGSLLDLTSKMDDSEFSFNHK